MTIGKHSCVKIYFKNKIKTNITFQIKASFTVHFVTGTFYILSFLLFYRVNKKKQHLFIFQNKKLYMF